MLHETIRRMFNKVFKFKFKVEVESADGWHEVDSLNVTEPVDVIEIVTTTGRKLKCAENHILYDENGDEVLAKNTLGKLVITEDGNEVVEQVNNLGYKEELYDLSLKDALYEI